jgi:endonuclease/exonuclease/phosphatase (EEP) superfamily protein YafD
MLTTCRVLAPEPRLWVLATSFVPFALVGYALASSGWWMVRRTSVAGRRRWTTGALVVSLLGVVLHAGLLMPAYLGAHATGRADLTVLTSNLRLGMADTDVVTRLAERAGADVAVFEEVTPGALAGLYAAGIRDELPYVAGMPNVGAFGTVVFSRYPLGHVTQLQVSKGTWLTRVAAKTPFWLVAVHTSQPLTSVALWHADQTALLASAKRLDGPLVMAGDFNETLDHRPMRRLLGAGLQDAARQTNAGWQPTWPGASDAAGGLPFGLGLMTLDHVLTSTQVVAISTSTELVPGSDHRALLARLAVR